MTRCVHLLASDCARAALASPPPLAGEGEGGGAFNGSCNRFQNALPIDHDVIAPARVASSIHASWVLLHAQSSWVLFSCPLPNPPPQAGEGAHRVRARSCYLFCRSALILHAA